MQQKDAKQLLIKQRQGLASEEEKAMLDSWYADWKRDEEIGLSELDYLAAEKEIYSKLSLTLQGHKRRALWPRFAAAACIIMVLGIGLYAYFQRSFVSTSSSQYLTAKNDIAPGKNSATLTLANGRKIRLSELANGKLAEEAGVSITKTANGQVVYTLAAGKEIPGTVAYNTLSTAKGEQYQIVLPDLTKIWLNSASSIKFPTTFAGLDTRKVEINGEAYFEVAKIFRKKRPGDTGGLGERIPFIVATDKQQVEVLGTHFNINSYTDEGSTKTTLLEGSVRVSLQAGNERQKTFAGSILKPGEQSTLTGETFKVEPANMEQALAWKNGQFYFKDTPLEMVMRQISRWYNVEIVYSDNMPKQILLGGWISRSKKISGILNMIELTGKAHFKVEGRRITVMP